MVPTWQWSTFHLHLIRFLFKVIFFLKKNLIIRLGVSIVSSFFFFSSSKMPLQASCLCLDSRHFDYGSRIFSMSWFSQMERAKGTWGTEHSRYSCTSVDWLVCNYFFNVRAGSPPLLGSLCEALRTPLLFKLLFFFVFCWRNEVKMGMLTKHLVGNFLIFLFVFHQLWTCAFHCPKKSLNIPLLHVLVIILVVFYQTFILWW